MILQNMFRPVAVAILVFSMMFMVAGLPVPAKKTCPSKCACNVDVARCVNEEGLRNFPKFLDSSSLRELEISGTSIDQVLKADLAAFENLEILDLSNNLIRYVEKDALADLKNLRKIFLAGNKFSCDGADREMTKIVLKGIVTSLPGVENDFDEIVCEDGASGAEPGSKRFLLSDSDEREDRKRRHESANDQLSPHDSELSPNSQIKGRRHQSVDDKLPPDNGDNLSLDDDMMSPDEGELPSDDDVLPPGEGEQPSDYGGDDDELSSHSHVRGKRQQSDDGGLPPDDGELSSHSNLRKRRQQSDDGKLSLDDGVLPPDESELPSDYSSLSPDEGELPSDYSWLPPDDGELSSHSHLRERSQQSNDDKLSLDDGVLPQDEGELPSDDDVLPPDEGEQPSDDDVLPPDEGELPSDDDVLPPGEGEQPSDYGGDDELSSHSHVRGKRQQSDDGKLSLDDGVLPPNESELPSDYSSLPPDEGVLPPDEGKLPSDYSLLPPPDEGELPSDYGGLPPEDGELSSHSHLRERRQQSDDVKLSLDDGVLPPDEGEQPSYYSWPPPDDGELPPDASGLPSDYRGLPPDDDELSADENEFSTNFHIRGRRYSSNGGQLSLSSQTKTIRFEVHKRRDGTGLIVACVIGWLVVASCATVGAYFFYRHRQKLKRIGYEKLTQEGESSKDQEAPPISQQHFVEKMRKQRRQSQGFAGEDIIDSDEEGVDAAEYIKGKMRQQRRKSQGYGQGSNSSLDEMTDICLN